MKTGLLIIISGPSGVGKGTVLKHVMADDSLNLAFSVSMTTRPQRAHEVDGQNYFFVSKDVFADYVKKDAFLEHVEFVGNSYGTPREYVESLRKKGINVVLEIEVEGAKQVMRRIRDQKVVTIFLIPPTFEELEKRILGRSTESAEAINERLEKAKRELSEKFLYQHIVLNDDPLRAADEIRSIIRNKLNTRIIG
ncbi:MAG: guanylate kinase [Bacilli bacterium]|jgi:guanylate kinase|nr:guanylate kinase [Bacilli bacterium]MDD3388734.1 guanylate kinase [Bacilli bacterium]MDD4344524.1 guanylate kinase [Bacilli bacterium]MDD4520418.1 guanylate kinase [Bacilli bacterium]MDY0399167.1 guanylate kinase [Bacilli bacterium]